MEHLLKIYEVWGHNAEAMATAIGETGVKTRQWRNRGNIPSPYWQRIIKAAKERGVKLELSQFIPPTVSDRGDHAPASISDPVIVCDVCQDTIGAAGPASCSFVDCPQMSTRLDHGAAA